MLAPGFRLAFFFCRFWNARLAFCSSSAMYFSNLLTSTFVLAASSISQTSSSIRGFLKPIDHVKDVYRKRAAVIGFRSGVVFHLLSGVKQESKATIDFALMMAEYTLEQQIKAFGEALQKEYVNASSECQRYGANHSVFDQLPPVFTMDDLRALKGSFCGEAALRKIISRWYRDHWIEKTERAHWRKLAISQL